MVAKHEPKVKVEKPAKLDAKRANKVIKRVMEDNVAWLKDMAKR